MTKYLLLCFFFLLSCSTSQRASRFVASTDQIKKLVIYVEGPRGGFGDVASNILMAKKLQKKGLDITLVVNEEAKEALSILLPEYNSTQEISQANNFTIYSYKKDSWPPGDAIAAFSSADRIPSDANFPTAYVLKEYSEMKNDYLGGNYVFSEEAFTMKSDFKARARKEKEVNFFTLIAGLNQFGAYIDEKKPLPPLSIAQLQSYVSAHYPSHNIDFSSPGLKIGFSYTNQVQPSQLYLDGVVKYINDNNINDDVVVFIKDFDDLKMEQLPHNLKLVRLKSLPFEVTQSLIAHSNIPIMVTGDVSLTLALEFEKLFFYELNDWKMHLTSDVIESLFSKGTELANDPAHVELKKLLYKMMSISPESPDLSSGEVSKIFQAVNFQKKFSSSVQKIRKKNSLPSNFIEFMKVANMFILPKETASDAIRPLMLLLFERENISANGLLEYAFRAFNDPNKSSQFKLRLFYSLLNLKDFSSKEIQDQLVKVIENADGKFWIELNDFIRRNAIKSGDDNRIISIMESAFRSGTPAAQKKVAAIINQLIEEAKPYIPSDLVEKASLLKISNTQNCNEAILIFLN